MSEHLPARVEPLRLAAAGQRLHGQIALAGMRRLSAALETLPAGTVEVDLQFGTDEGRIPFLRGSVRARLAPVCQRCLEPMDFPVDAQLSLGLVGSEAEAARLPERYEPLLVEPHPMALSDIIEDELLLALPVVALHENPRCRAPGAEHDAEAAEGPQEASNPFGVLRALKRKD